MMDWRTFVDFASRSCKVDRVADIAIQSFGSPVPARCPLALTGKRLVDVAQVVLRSALVGHLFDEICPGARGIPRCGSGRSRHTFQRRSERVHALVAFPAILGLGFVFQTLAQGLVMVLGNHRVHRHGHIGNGAGEEFFAHPFAAADGVGGGVSGERDEPGGVREHALAVRHFGGLRGRIVPTCQIDVEGTWPPPPFRDCLPVRVFAALGTPKTRRERDRGHHRPFSKSFRVVGHHPLENLHLSSAPPTLPIASEIQAGHRVLFEEWRRGPFSFSASKFFQSLSLK